jgi:hypothetical protein
VGPGVGVADGVGDGAGVGAGAGFGPGVTGEGAGPGRGGVVRGVGSGPGVGVGSGVGVTTGVGVLGEPSLQLVTCSATNRTAARMNAMEEYGRRTDMTTSSRSDALSDPPESSSLHAACRPAG